MPNRRSKRSRSGLYCFAPIYVLFVVCATALMAFDDPIAVKLKGTSISILPDFVLVASGDPKSAWSDFVEKRRVAASEAKEVAEEAGMFVASSRGVTYLFVEPTLLQRVFSEVDASLSSQSVFYVWASIDRDVQASWASEFQLVRIDTSKAQDKRGCVFQASENYYAWFINADTFESCPMHPYFVVDTSPHRCAICEMPKVTLEQIPEWKAAK